MINNGYKYYSSFPYITYFYVEKTNLFFYSRIYYFNDEYLQELISTEKNNDEVKQKTIIIIIFYHFVQHDNLNYGNLSEILRFAL